jgi:hypothetical protein
MRQQAEHGVTAAQAQVALRESRRNCRPGPGRPARVELDAAQRRLARSQTLSQEGAASIQELDDDRARVRGAQATLAASKAQAAAARAAVEAAKAQLVGAQSSVHAATASINRIEADIRDSELRAPRDGRVQYRVAQPGEVLGAGGRVLNMIDLSDVYMTFFLPETVAGRVALGSEVRLVLDAAPEYVIPAKVSFVASAAQFTPKTVETASERQKLMFRVRRRSTRRSCCVKHLEPGQDRIARRGLCQARRQCRMAPEPGDRAAGVMMPRGARSRPARGAGQPALRQRRRAGRRHLDIPAGRMVGLIGPDGVGKSSLLSLLAGARASRRARSRCWAATWAARPIATQVCPRIAYMPQGLGKNLYPTLSVEENVDFFGRLFGQARRNAAAHRRAAGQHRPAPFADRRANSPAA